MSIKMAPGAFQAILDRIFIATLNLWFCGTVKCIILNHYVLVNVHFCYSLGIFELQRYKKLLQWNIQRFLKCSNINLAQMFSGHVSEDHK